ncbi:ABC-type Mn2+/Zn2+ transport system/ ATP-binding component [Synechococcus sp. BIOS-E4-1]|uniref:metal ABC transporter ATP-binding protein n=1 Tax=Synechococcus sp. BIOS-E4-1 TaxID=1400864 RepID=UPI0016494809|nr:ABC transporter ATP-binding protein [Synechococcus sp. BIOS-E4-1]QNI54124.1 ABC-type Mn2+/Zn2+ transport system/ ATP-binding component [Synechococcus sp. BIOS-E4-1]
MRVAPLVAHRLSVSYGDRVVVDDVSLTLESGTLTALVGANGTGKSTLLHLLQGRLTPSAGKVACDGMPIQSSRDRVVLMPQRGRIDWSFPITVRDFVALGEIGHQSFGCCDREAALQRVGLETLATRRLDALSGGQQQRALLARTLVQPSRVLLLDEPCAAIDPPSREKLLALMRQLADSGHTLLVSNHDWGTALDLYDRVIVLDGRVLADGPPQQVRRMLSSQPDRLEHSHE